MERYKNNLVDFRCFSNGNNEINTGFFQSETVPASYKLMYVYEGEMKIDIDGTCYTAKKGYSVLVFPYQSFDIRHEKNLRYTWIEFSGFAGTAMLARIAFSKNTPVLGKIEMQDFEELFAMPENNDEAYSLYRFGGCMMLLLSFYIENFPSKAVEHDGYVIRACRYINENFSSPSFGVKDVAEKLMIDRSYLYRLFKDEMGVSVIDYITRCRISRAEVMLSNDRQSIKDVAYSVGFTDQMYFSRVFKKLNGRTPTQFREMLFEKKTDRTLQ